MQPAAAPRPPQPWSADDVNPVRWRGTAATEWLSGNGSFLPPSSHPPGSSSQPWLAQPPSHNPDPGAKPKVLDIRQLTRAQLGAAARKHNAALNITDPIGAVLDGIRETAKLVDPDRAVYPFTLGGNPRKDATYGAAWQAVAKPAGRGPGFGTDDTRKQATAKPAATAGAARTADSSAARVPTTSGVQPRTVPLPAAAPKVAYGTLTPEQQRFVSVLSAFLGIKVKLPLLAPGAQALDLKRLYQEVHALGGFKGACATDSWPQLARSLQNDSKLAGVLKQVYHYYLLPVEEELPREAEIRPARLMEFLEYKTKEREACPAFPNSAKVSKALATCSEELQRWATPATSVTAAATTGNSAAADPGPASSSPLDAAPRLALQLLRHLSRTVVDCAAGGLRLETKGAVSAALAAWQRQQQQRHEGKEGVAGTAAAPDGLPSRLASDLESAQTSGGAAGQHGVVHGGAPVIAVLGAGDGARVQAMAEATVAVDGTEGVALAASVAATDGMDVSVALGETTARVQGCEAAAAAASTVASGPTLPNFLTWNEVQPLEALLVSYRQLRAGPRVLHLTPPNLKEHYLSQLRPGEGGAGGGGGGAPPLRRGEAFARHAVTDVPQVSVRKRINKGITPRCGDCRTCNNRALKKACMTNRERLEAGKEPIFLTEEARAYHLQKRAKVEEDE